MIMCAISYAKHKCLCTEKKESQQSDLKYVFPILYFKGFQLRIIVTFDLIFREDFLPILYFKRLLIENYTYIKFEIWRT